MFPSGALKLFCDDDRRKISKHPLNKRDNAAYQTKLARGVGKIAVIYGVRGDPWLVFSRMPAPHSPFQSIAWAQLINGIYEAFETLGHLPTVKRVLAQGLVGAKFYDGRIPNSVVLWMKSFHNEFNDGHATSVADWFMDIDSTVCSGSRAGVIGSMQPIQ